MKNTMTILLSAFVVCLLGGALLFVEQNVTKAYASCTPNCNVSWQKVGEVCYIWGEFCLDASYLDDFWFFTKVSGGSWSAGIKLSAITLACADGCTGYKLNRTSLPCASDSWRVCYGQNPGQNIQCDGIISW
jgi:hypothetical protein